MSKGEALQGQGRARARRTGGQWVALGTRATGFCRDPPRSFGVRHGALGSATEFWGPPRSFGVRHGVLGSATEFWGPPRSFGVRHGVLGSATGFWGPPRSFGVRHGVSRQWRPADDARLGCERRAPASRPRIPVHHLLGQARRASPLARTSPCLCLVIRSPSAPCPTDAVAAQARRWTKVYGFRRLPWHRHVPTRTGTGNPPADLPPTARGRPAG